MSKKLIPEEISRLHDNCIYVPGRLIYLSGEIDEDRVNEFIKNIRLLDFVSDEDITVLINSEGGSVHQGMAAHDAVKECNSKVIAHVVGVAYSMSSIIFQAADERIMSPNSTLMIHIGQEGYEEDHPSNLDRWLKENRRIGGIADDILYERIKEKKPRFTKKQLQKIIEYDTIYTSKQAMEMGLVDEIAEHKEF